MRIPQVWADRVDAFLWSSHNDLDWKVARRSPSAHLNGAVKRRTRLMLNAGVIAIAWVNWYVFMARKAAVTARAPATCRQKVSITVEGGYSPSVVRVKKGKRLRLIFNRKEKSPCSDEVLISDLGIRRFLKLFEKTAIDLDPSKAGLFEFTCGMSMLRGRIDQQPGVKTAEVNLAVGEVTGCFNADFHEG